MFVTVYVWSRTYVPKSSRHEVTFHQEFLLMNFVNVARNPSMITYENLPSMTPSNVLYIHVVTLPVIFKNFSRTWKN